MKLFSGVMLLLLSLTLQAPAPAGPFTALDPGALIDLIETIRDDPEVSSEDLLHRTGG